MTPGLSRPALALLALAAGGASPPEAVWRPDPSYALVIPPDIPEEPAVPPAPPMIAPAPWAPPLLFGQPPSEVRQDWASLPEVADGPFSVELWLADHVNHPVGLLAAGVDGDGAPAWTLGYFSLLGNGKFTGDPALRFGPLEWLPDRAAPRFAPYRSYLHHIVGSFDGHHWRLFHNGVLVAEAEGAARPFRAVHMAGYLAAEPHMRMANLLRGAWLHGQAIDAAGAQAAFAARTAEIAAATRGTGKQLRFTAGPYLTPPGTREQKLLWETDRPATGRVEWGPTAAFGHALEFTDAARLHRATLPALAPATKYFYGVTARDAAGEVLDSGTLAFRTMPAEGRPLVFAVVGDTQERPFINARLSRLIWQQRPQFVVLAGDLVGGEEDERRWHWTDEFFPGMGPLVERVPALAVRGNGDVDVVDPAQDRRLFTNFDRYHNQPDEGRGYYSYRIGDAEFFVLDGNLALRERQEPGFRKAQRAWLDQALGASTARWKIALHHQPAYSSDDDDYGNGYAAPTTGGDPEIRADFVDLYERHGVDLALSGHIHGYERSWPLRAGKPACGGVTYVVSGGGGGDSERAAPAASPTAATLHSGFHFLLARLWQDRLEIEMRDAEGRLRDSFALAPHAIAARRCEAGGESAEPRR
ncbi:conserved hypothetical protein [Altererythrobacter sp. B11]|uniref:metallophosphoesterase n=1 Tax=Altererythrobacter sp. B11 TaxID=2060312 RepID=UPI000DC715A4|nr:metallophosphoesterase [Altererythrobacter sp. B11]BBC71968.1 conserved hypothetical protein [Altererythrobacter sp. B11]